MDNSAQGKVAASTSWIEVAHLYLLDLLWRSQSKIQAIPQQFFSGCYSLLNDFYNQLSLLKKSLSWQRCEIAVKILHFLSQFNLFIGIQVITDIVDFNVLSRRFSDRNILFNFLDVIQLSGNFSWREFLYLKTFLIFHLKTFRFYQVKPRLIKWLRWQLAQLQLTDFNPRVASLPVSLPVYAF